MTNYMLSTPRTRSLLLLALGTTLMLMIFFTCAQIASADGIGNVDSVNGVCMQDVYATFGQGGSLNCTANDVSLATATNITILDDGCAFPGDTVTFSANFEVQVTAGSRATTSESTSRATAILMATAPSLACARFRRQPMPRTLRGWIWMGPLTTQRLRIASAIVPQIAA